MPSDKSWSEKLREDKGFPKVEKITERISKKWGTGTIVIPAPIEVDEIMRKVPRGKVIAINEIRASLARKHKAARARSTMSQRSSRSNRRDWN